MCMGGDCSDPVINSLKDINYNAVRLPRSDIRPLQILVRDGHTLSRLGGLTDLFVQGDQAVPAITADTAAATINGQQTHAMDAALGLSLLGSVIRALGGNLGLEVAYKDAKSVTFQFSDVTSDSINIINLDSFLGAASVNSHARSAAQMLDADALYVITEVIKTAKLDVLAKKSDGTDLKVDVPVIRQIIGGNIKVGTSDASETHLSYQGSLPLVFGIKAVHLFYDKGKYQSIKVAPRGDGSLGMTGGLAKRHEQRDYLAAESAFVRIEDL